MPGHPFAITFLIFALYDYFSIPGFNPDMLAVITIIDLLTALGSIAHLSWRT
jgi:hypothetical protein